MHVCLVENILQLKSIMTKLLGFIFPQIRSLNGLSPWLCPEGTGSHERFRTGDHFPECKWARPVVLEPIQGSLARSSQDPGALADWPGSHSVERQQHIAGDSLAFLWPSLQPADDVRGRDTTRASSAWHGRWDCWPVWSKRDALLATHGAWLPWYVRCRMQLLEVGLWRLLFPPILLRAWPVL